MTRSKKPATALAVVDVPALPAPRTVADIATYPVEQQQALLTEWDARRSSFRAWVEQHLVRGVHYGFPPGCRKSSDPAEWQDKPSLYKAGAHLVADLLSLQRPEYTFDMDLWAILGQPTGTVCIVCTLRTRDGAMFAVGRGTMERDEKKMAVNARVKIAQKRAFVDAMISGVPLLAELFTQDLEDGDPSKLGKQVDDRQRGRERMQRERERPKAPQASREPPMPAPPTDKQRERAASLLADERLTADQRAWLQRKLDTQDRDAWSKAIFAAKRRIEEATGEPYEAPEDEPEREPGQEG